MTIIYPETFRQSASAGFDGVFDWDFLKPAFEGTKIMPMDLDCVVERKGNFLCFETKSGMKPIPLGQEITLRALVLSRKWIVVILRAKLPVDITGWDVWYFSTAKNEFTQKYRDGGADDLVRFTRRWFQWADGKIIR